GGAGPLRLRGVRVGGLARGLALRLLSRTRFRAGRFATTAHRRFPFRAFGLLRTLGRGLLRGRWVLGLAGVEVDLLVLGAFALLLVGGFAGCHRPLADPA